MRKEPDEIEYEIIKAVVENPGCRMRDCYRHLIGKPYKETFLWSRVQLLVEEKYLERREIGLGRVRIYPTRKAKALISGENNGKLGRRPGQ